MDDPADHAPVIDPMRAAPAAWQQRFKPIPFAVAEPIKLFPHQGLPRFGNLESQLGPRRNPY